MDEDQTTTKEGHSTLSEAENLLSSLNGNTLPTSSILDWCRFIPFALTFLTICIIADIWFRLARPKGMQALESVAAWLNRNAVRALRVVLGMRLELNGVKDFPVNRPYIIVCNHQSMFDIVILHTCLSSLRPRFIAKTELSRGLPGVSICLRSEGSALVNRSDSKQAMKELMAFAKRANQFKFAAVLFPEGTRSRRGAMKSFIPGGFAILNRYMPEAKIIPVAIDGSWRFSVHSKGPMPYGNQVKLRIGEALSPEGKSHLELLKLTEKTISEMLHEMRIDDPQYSKAPT